MLRKRNEKVQAQIERQGLCPSCKIGQIWFSFESNCGLGATCGGLLWTTSCAKPARAPHPATDMAGLLQIRCAKIDDQFALNYGGHSRDQARRHEQFQYSAHLASPAGAAARIARLRAVTAICRRTSTE
jgi:hypothetical protein